jgi:pathogenesis-related protein 1
MRLLASILTILVAGGCGGGGDDDLTDGGNATPDAPGGVGEPAALAGITLAHNEVRAAHGVPPLVWDPALAATAQAWAEACVDSDAPIGLIDHNPNRSDGHPWYVGENIYGSSGPANGRDAVTAWASEEQFYDYASNTCAGGQICGHYTQIVWAATTNVGCGLATCAGLTYGNGIVCDYGPGGNDGGRPY